MVLKVLVRYRRYAVGIALAAWVRAELRSDSRSESHGVWL